MGPDLDTSVHPGVEGNRKYMQICSKLSQRASWLILSFINDILRFFSKSSVNNELSILCLPCRACFGRFGGILYKRAHNASNFIDKNASVNHFLG